MAYLPMQPPANPEKFTAQDAVKLSEKNCKDLSDVIGTIKTMAGSGNRFATFESQKIKDIQFVCDELKVLGYEVVDNGKYLNINW